ncbi:hypothetical protein VB005_09652 [Metarhizium brunneum]
MDQRDVKVRVDQKASPDETENYQRWAKRDVESPDGTENYQRWAKREVDHSTMQAHNMME